MKTVCGKEVKFEKEFAPGGETFSGINAAREYLKKKGFSVGSMQRGSFIAVKKGDHVLPKWRNLSSGEILGLDGVIAPCPEGFREGSATVILNVDPEAK